MQYFETKFLIYIFAKQRCLTFLRNIRECTVVYKQHFFSPNFSSFLFQTGIGKVIKLVRDYPGCRRYSDEYFRVILSTNYCILWFISNKNFCSHQRSKLIYEYTWITTSTWNYCSLKYTGICRFANRKFDISLKT